MIRGQLWDHLYHLPIGPRHQRMTAHRLGGQGKGDYINPHLNPSGKFFSSILSSLDSQLSSVTPLSHLSIGEGPHRTQPGGPPFLQVQSTSPPKPGLDAPCINTLHLKSLNHISLVCRSVEESMDFYQNILGFVPIRRPGSFDFNGAWLFGYGIGIHLLQSEDPENIPKKKNINPKDKHISFQCESMGTVEKKLKEFELEHVRAIVEEGGILVEQLFFHDPDGFMIEICNCDNLPVIPLTGEMVRSCSRLNLKLMQPQQIHQVVQQ
ncbi:hypothetical protein PTKIN_Ptkin18bG0044400 [Pterospermum kingtungense]